MKKRCLMFLLGAMVWMLALAVVAPAVPLPADHVVDQYVRADYRGVRLAETDPAIMKPLTAWAKEPEWAVVTVVKSFEVGQPRRAPDGIRVDVNYVVLGELVGNRWIAREPGQRKSRTIFKVRQVDSRPRIIGPKVPPHVSLGAMVSHLRRQSDSKYGPARAELEQLLAESAAYESSDSK